MEQDRQRYRKKLPGRRRGFLFGSTIWMGTDHLLLVKSARFREEYKRFYFRDVQAIVTAKAPRFHISTRSGLIGFLWLWAFGFSVGSALAPRGTKWAVGLIGMLLVLVWAYQSGKCSCRCRIYTAVSSDELPSLYRTWTARRFLEAVEPAIAQAQGSIEGNWAEAVEDKQIGPLPIGRVGIAIPPIPGMAASPPPAPATSRTSVSILFVASLCLGGLAELLTLRVSANMGRWILLGFLLLQLFAAVAVLVQNYLGILRAALRNLAIVMVAAVGVWYYSVQIVVGAAISYRNATSRNSRVQVQMEPLTITSYPLSRGIAGGFSLLLGLAGVILLMREERPPEERVSFNV